MAPIGLDFLVAADVKVDVFINIVTSEDLALLGVLDELFRFGAALVGGVLEWVYGKILSGGRGIRIFESQR